MWFTRCFCIFLFCTFTVSADSTSEDAESKPCELLEEEYGYVCVCNSTYCDNEGQMPTTLDEGQFIVYTSTKSGKRFAYNSSQMTNGTTSSSSLWSSLVPEIGLTKLTLTIDKNVTYQEILGFGGAFTDSAGINIMNMSESVQESILRSYFSEEGLQYNMGRVPIGGSDFSTRGYSYNDYPTNDSAMANFTLAEEDFAYKIPLIKRALNMSSETILLTSAVWSPPTWMKTKDDYVGGYLKSEYYDAYSQYHIKFLEEYKENGIDIWGISTGNEPSSGLISLLSGISSLGWSPSDQADWVVNNFGPAIRNSSEFNNTKILFLDDQRPMASLWLPLMSLAESDLVNYMDAISLHWYFDLEITDFVMDHLREKYPDKWIINNEACIGYLPLQTAVEIGSWSRGETYLKYLIADLNHEVNAWLDWNLALDLSGGPNWQGNTVDAFILVNPDKDEFYKQPMYYAFGHVSKFVPRQSFRIKAEDSDLLPIHYTAFLRPDGYVVVVVLNDEVTSKSLVINDGDLSMEWTLEAHSITTIIYNPGA